MTDEEFTRRLAELVRDRRHGASELARRCLEIGAESALGAPAADPAALRRLLAERATTMARARPAMAPIDNLLARWRAALEGAATSDLSRFRDDAAAAARALIEDSRAAVGRAAARAARHLGPGRTVMTHSLSSTVVELFRRLRDGGGVRAIVTESRPLCEGYELARRLSAWAIPTTLVTDAQIGLFVAEADAVVVGADALLPDGAAVNKAGTYPLALAARDAGVPFYVCCESFKRRRADTPAPFEPEEMDAAELGAPALPGVTVRNVYFDVTPARLIDGWFTERDDGPATDDAPAPVSGPARRGPGSPGGPR